MYYHRHLDCVAKYMFYFMKTKLLLLACLCLLLASCGNDGNLKIYDPPITSTGDLDVSSFFEIEDASAALTPSKKDAFGHEITVTVRLKLVKEPTDELKNATGEVYITLYDENGVQLEQLYPSGGSIPTQVDQPTTITATVKRKNQLKSDNEEYLKTIKKAGLIMEVNKAR